MQLHYAATRLCGLHTVSNEEATVVRDLLLPKTKKKITLHVPAEADKFRFISALPRVATTGARLRFIRDPFAASPSVL